MQSQSREDKAWVCTSISEFPFLSCAWPRWLHASLHPFPPLFLSVHPYQAVCRVLGWRGITSPQGLCLHGDTSSLYLIQVSWDFWGGSHLPAHSGGHEHLPLSGKGQCGRTTRYLFISPISPKRSFCYRTWRYIFTCLVILIHYLHDYIGNFSI